MIPDKIKYSDTFDKFKESIKTWKPDKCPCRLCKSYIHGQGYLNVVQHYLDPI